MRTEKYYVSQVGFGVAMLPVGDCSGGRGCLGEGRLGLPCRVWELRSLPSFLHFLEKIAINQKNPRVRKFFCPQFWGRKWLRQFYGRLEKCVLSAGKNHVRKIPPFRGGGFTGGGGVPILFLWARGFF